MVRQAYRSVQMSLDPVSEPLRHWRSHRVSERVIAEGVVRLLVPFNFARDRPVRREGHDALAFVGHETPDFALLGIAHVVPAPVSPRVSRRFRVQAVSDRGRYCSFAARMFKDSLKGRKSGLPILSARRSIPFAAFGLKKYLRGTFPVLMTPNKEDSLS